MKRVAGVLLIFLLLFCACGKAQQTEEPVLSAPPTIPSSVTLPTNRTLRIAVTDMLADSPMLGVLCELFSQQTGYRTELSVNTDSVSISVAETGKMDILIAQQGADASRFLSAGYADSSIDWLTDVQIFAGPADDPAKIAEADSTAQALQRIAKSGSLFVSRYDDSDISRKETHLWASCGVSIGNGKRWYKALRLSMLPSLQQASSLGAYIYTDLETFLRNARELNLQILLQNLPELQTTYCILPITDARFPSVNTEGVKAFLSFLREDSTVEYLRAYGSDLYGRPIYTVHNF